MPVYVYVKNKHRRIAAGDLDRRLTIYSRTLTTPSQGGVDFTQTFANANTVWCMLETKKGVTIFDGINIKGVATHLFYIRWYAGLTAENWVDFCGEYYDILTAENLDERSEYWCLKCCVRGAVPDPASQAGADGDD